MTDKELQEAIDKARQFVQLDSGSSEHTLLHLSRQSTASHLRVLEQIQQLRAEQIVSIDFAVEENSNEKQ